MDHSRPFPETHATAHSVSFYTPYSLLMLGGGWGGGGKAVQISSKSEDAAPRPSFMFSPPRETEFPCRRPFDWFFFPQRSVGLPFKVAFADCR